MSEHPPSGPNFIDKMNSAITSLFTWGPPWLCFLSLCGVVGMAVILLKL